jgi:hypothetical protein
VPDDSARARSGEQMGEEVVRALEDGNRLRAGDVSVDWVILAGINSIDEAGRLRRRQAVLCMQDLDPETRAALIELRSAEQPFP